jgi:hypothetical protein
MAINFFRRNRGGSAEGTTRVLQHDAAPKSDISEHVEALRKMAQTKGYKPLHAEDSEARDMSHADRQQHPTTRNEWDARSMNHSNATEALAKKANDTSPYAADHHRAGHIEDLANHIKQGMKQSGPAGAHWDKPSPFERDHRGVMDGGSKYLTHREQAHKVIDQHVADAKSKLQPMKQSSPSDWDTHSSWNSTPAKKDDWGSHDSW